MAHLATASKDGITITAYRGDGSVLLGLDLDEHLTDHFAGFAIRWTAPGAAPSYLENRLSFDKPLGSQSTPGERQAAWTSSDKAPFQRFRWQHFPPSPVPGDHVYEASAVYFAKSGSGLENGPMAKVAIDLTSADFGNLEVGFTRSYVSSQAYVEKFGNRDIRKLPKTLDYDTKPFLEQYEYLGYHARKMVFDFLDECVRDRSMTLDVFAYDIDEPDFVHGLESLGSRLRIYLDDAPLHTGPTALEPEVKRRLIRSAGASNVKSGHFRRFSHDKVLIQKKDGKPQKVLTGSANFSVRGLYVQANNVLVFRDPGVAALYESVFAQVWASASAFSQSKLAQGWFDELSVPGLPPFEACFSPHKNASVSLQKVADAISGAKSSVLFAVMELGGAGPVLKKLQGLATKGGVFSYGVTQNVTVQKKGGETQEKTTGVRVHGPGSSAGVLVPFAFLQKNVPEPFQAEVSGGAGQVIHNKFVVVDFNDSSPAVFTGSSNLAEGGEQSNGDNLLAIEDRAVATLYGVEATRLVDHFRFRAALKGATAKPLVLESNPKAKTPWWKPYYDPKSERFRERKVFVQ